ncbi:conserved hypothetical protein [Ricinus communis]|uniref:Uncharacterized protein n=1 Tax=Ricinus communis TaxID=3988 RepID=B9S5Q1_RICCO|nr:conserved hypothetical protein [Ricinus communis]
MTKKIKRVVKTPRNYPSKRGCYLNMDMSCGFYSKLKQTCMTWTCPEDQFLRNSHQCLLACRLRVRKEEESVAVTCKPNPCILPNVNFSCFKGMLCCVTDNLLVHNYGSKTYFGTNHCNWKGPKVFKRMWAGLYHTDGKLLKNRPTICPPQILKSETVVDQKLASEDLFRVSDFFFFFFL